MGNIWFQLLSSIIIGGITAILADWRGRSRMTWFYIGMFFGPFGLLALLLVPKKKSVENKSSPTREKNVVQRIEEARVKAENAPPLLEWFYVDIHTKQAVGPISLIGLLALWKKGVLGDRSFVWSKQLQEWTPIGDVDLILSSNIHKNVLENDAAKK